MIERSGSDPEVEVGDSQRWLGEFSGTGVSQHSSRARPISQQDWADGGAGDGGSVCRTSDPALRVRARGQWPRAWVLRAAVDGMGNGRAHWVPLRASAALTAARQPHPHEAHSDE